MCLKADAFCEERIFPAATKAKMEFTRLSLTNTFRLLKDVVAEYEQAFATQEMICIQNIVANRRSCRKTGKNGSA